MIKDVTIIDHTADIGIRLSRDRLETVFVDAALAMFDIIAPDSTFLEKETREVQVEAEDIEQLLVNWLSELNVLLQLQQFVPARLSILEMDKHILKARLFGERIDPRAHQIEIEIKAVTYHNLKVKQESGRWSVQVLFDI